MASPRNVMTIFRFFLVIVLAAALAAGALVWYGLEQFKAAGPHDRSIVVIVEPGSGLNMTARILASEGVIASPDIFRWTARLKRRDRDLRAGEYEIPARAS
ncbi:MAG: hypothetical protein WEB93_01665, partial [Sphingomonadales bacterium]